LTKFISLIIQRKIIHLATAFLPALYLAWLNREQMIILSGLLSIGFLTVDLLRFRSKNLRSIFIRVFDPLLKHEEKNKKITGATHLFLSATIIIIIFSREIAVPALFILSISDAFAAIAGILFGKHQLFYKTWEGSLVFFLLTCIIVMFTNAEILAALIIGFITAVVEVLPLPINDNYSVALASAIMLYIIF
jgi:dolichol kinase